MSQKELILKTIEKMYNERKKFYGRGEIIERVRQEFPELNEKNWVNKYSPLSVGIDSLWKAGEIELQKSMKEPGKRGPNKIQKFAPLGAGKELGIEIDTSLQHEGGTSSHKNKRRIPLNQILYGPPGTGKTYNTVVKALEILEPDVIEWASDGHNVKNYSQLQERFNEYADEGRIKFITFHQSYSYEEFIEGIKPEVEWGAVEDRATGVNKEIRYVGKGGLFKNLCAEAKKTDKPYVLIIDEINRGNISKIFGELITLLEDTKRDKLRVKLPYSQDDFVVPRNLYIIGTMNTADRSIVSVDLALRRRFTFIEMPPEEKLIKFNHKRLDLSEFVKKLNDRITILLDKDHRIGHGYFMTDSGDKQINGIEQLKVIWFDKILPLLNEYFYGDWEKLRLVMPGFVVKKYINNAAFKEAVDDYYYDFKIKFKSDDDFINALLEEPKEDNK